MRSSPPSIRSARRNKTPRGSCGVGVGARGGAGCPGRGNVGVSVFGAGGASSRDGFSAISAACANDEKDPAPTAATNPAIEPANHFIGGKKRKWMGRLECVDFKARKSRKNAFQRKNPINATEIIDARAGTLSDWLAAVLGTRSYSIAPASEDASFRRYFRVTPDSPHPLCGDARTLIAMDAPPPRENCAPFVRIAALLIDAGVHAPAVLAQDLDRGFLLLSDLGETTYLQALDNDNADQLFGDALDALVRWQRATRENVLPPYDGALLRRELELFPEWYVRRHLGFVLTDAERASLSGIFDRIIAANLAQAKVFVHRDFMPRNLMHTMPNPGVLDFQDAVIGPISYDVACLFKDAFISWPEERVLDWTIRYWERARHARLPVPTDFSEFWRDVEWMGLQRHLKVLGIFARIRHRDGKSGYVEDTARFIAYVRPVAQRYRE